MISEMDPLIDYPSLLPGESFQVIKKGDGASSPGKPRQLEFSESTLERRRQRENSGGVESLPKVLINAYVRKQAQGKKRPKGLEQYLLLLVALPNNTQNKNLISHGA